MVSELITTIRVNQLLSTEPITEKSTLKDIIHTLPRLYEKAITDTELCMDRNVLIRILNRIKRAAGLNLYGSGISYILAQSAAFKFSTLGMEASAYESINAHYLSAGKKKKTVSIIITFTGANRSMIEIARYLRETTENYVVGITGCHNKEMKKWCHETVEIPSRDSLLSLKVVTSFTATTYVLDLFFSMLLAETYESHVKSSLEMVCHESLRVGVDYWNLKDGPGDEEAP